MAHLKRALGRFSFHLRELHEKCIEYKRTGRSKRVLVYFRQNFTTQIRELPENEGGSTCMILLYKSHLLDLQHKYEIMHDTDHQAFKMVSFKNCISVTPTIYLPRGNFEDSFPPIHGFKTVKT